MCWQFHLPLEWLQRFDRIAHSVHPEWSLLSVQTIYGFSWVFNNQEETEEDFSRVKTSHCEFQR